MGVGRYIRLVGQPAEAELALTVQDAYQGRGRARCCSRVGVAALADGVERLAAHVLQDNAPMCAMLRRAGGKLQTDEPGLCGPSSGRPARIGWSSRAPWPSWRPPPPRPAPAFPAAPSRSLTSSIIVSRRSMGPSSGQGCWGWDAGPAALGRG